MTFWVGHTNPVNVINRAAFTNWLNMVKFIPSSSSDQFINELPLSKFIHAAPSRASGQNHPDCEPSVFDCKPLQLVRPFPQRMKSWPIYRQGQPSFDE